MRIGTTTMVFWNDPASEAVRKIADAGFDAAEIWIEHVDRLGDENEYERVARALAQTGLAATVHCPILDLNITSPNAGIRAESLRQQIRALRKARDLGAELFVLHPGRVATQWDDLDEHRRLQREAQERLLEEADALGMRIGFENMEVRNPLHTVKTADDMLQALAPFSHPLLGVTLDIAHLGDQQLCADFIRRLGPRLFHVHASDAADDGRPHLPLGTGVLDLAEIVRELRAQNYRGLLSLEVVIPGGDVERLRREGEKARQALRSSAAGPENPAATRPTC